MNEDKQLTPRQKVEESFGPNSDQAYPVAYAIATELEQAQAKLAWALFELREIHIDLSCIRNDCTDGRNWRMMLGNVARDLREALQQRDTYRATLDRMTVELERYGNHDIECKFNSVQNGHNGPCTCGYQAALDAAKGGEH